MTNEERIEQIREAAEPWLEKSKRATEKGRKLNARFARVYAQHERNEAELLRAQNRWQKSRALLKRLGKQLDQALAEIEQAPQIETDPFKDEV